MTECYRYIWSSILALVLLGSCAAGLGYQQRQSYEEQRAEYERQAEEIAYYQAQRAGDGLALLRRLDGQGADDPMERLYELSAETGTAVLELHREIQGETSRLVMTGRGSFYQILALWEKMEMALPLHRLKVLSLEQGNTQLQTVFAVEFLHSEGVR